MKRAIREDEKWNLLLRSIPLYLRMGCALPLLFVPIPVAVTS